MTSSTDFFDLFHCSAWRLELLPSYGPDEAAFRAHQERRPLSPAEQARRERWRSGVAEATRAGKRVGRVHVVSRPLTDYLRWQLGVYAGSVAAGEDVRIADRGAHPELASLTRDFWLFDAELGVAASVLLMDYEPDGRFLGSVHTNDPGELVRYKREREVAMACSVPLSEFSAVAA